MIQFLVRCVTVVGGSALALICYYVKSREANDEATMVRKKKHSEYRKLEEARHKLKSTKEDVKTAFSQEHQASLSRQYKNQKIIEELKRQKQLVGGSGSVCTSTVPISCKLPNITEFSTAIKILNAKQQFDPNTTISVATELTEQRDECLQLIMAKFLEHIHEKDHLNHTHSV